MTDDKKDIIGSLLGAETELKFVSYDDAVDIQSDCVQRYGGSAGVRDASLLKSALARPMQAAAYSDDAQVHALAAILCHGIIKNHPFVDGNKRTGFFCMAEFLRRNSAAFDPDPAEAVEMIQRLAAGEIDELDLGAWVKKSSIAAVGNFNDWKSAKSDNKNTP